MSERDERPDLPPQAKAEVQQLLDEIARRRLKRRLAEASSTHEAHTAEESEE